MIPSFKADAAVVRYIENNKILIRNLVDEPRNRNFGAKLIRRNSFQTSFWDAGNFKGIIDVNKATSSATKKDLIN